MTAVDPRPTVDAPVRSGGTLGIVFALVRSQLRILRNDPWFLVTMSGMTLVVMPLFSRTMGLSLQADGYADATGAEQVVPGQVVLFGFFVAGSAGFVVFREHGWKTWDRLRASAAGGPTLLAGFGIPWVVIHTAWQCAMFAIGGLMLGLDVALVAVPTIVAVAVGYSVVVIGLILFATATFRTVNQLQALQNVGAMTLAGLGGAFVPPSQLPGWAQAVGPFTPTHWAMEGYRGALLDRATPVDVALELAILFGAGLVLFVLAARRFRLDETKEFFA